MLRLVKAGALLSRRQYNNILLRLPCHRSRITMVTPTLGYLTVNDDSISAKVQSALAEAGSVAEQSLSLVRVVRAHANEPHERRRYCSRVYTVIRRSSCHPRFGGEIDLLFFFPSFFVLLEIRRSNRAARLASRLSHLRRESLKVH